MADINTLTAQARGLWYQVQSAFGSLGYSTTLTSAGRTASHNATIAGASSTSQHIGGNAFDFQVRDSSGNIMDPLAVQSTISQLGLSYGQNIAEYGAGMNPRNHLSVPTSTLQGQNKIGKDGVYSSNIPSPTSALAEAGLGQGRQFLQDSFKAMGLGDFGQKIANGISDGLEATGNALQAPGKAISGFTENWIIRGAIAAVAILLLAAAIFSMTKIPEKLTI